MNSVGHILAQLYDLLNNDQHKANLARYVGNHIQSRYGISDFFQSIARTATKIILLYLVRSGRSFVGDLFDGSKSPVEAAQARTVEALTNMGERTQKKLSSYNGFTFSRCTTLFQVGTGPF